MTCERWLSFVGRAPRIRWVINFGFARVAWIAIMGSRSLQLRRRAWASMVLVINDIGATSTVVLWHSALPVTEVSK